MKAVVAAFNQEKAIVGAFSVITNIRRMELFQALLSTPRRRINSASLRTNNEHRLRSGGCEVELYTVYEMFHIVGILGA